MIIFIQIIFSILKIEMTKTSNAFGLISIIDSMTF